MTGYDLLQWLNFSAVLIVIGILAWYTIDIYRERREARTEVQRPILSLICEPGNPGSSMPVVQLVNVGNGPALDIVADDIIIDQSIVLRGQGIVYLAPGERAQAPWVRLTPAGNPFEDVLSWENAQMTAAEIMINTVTVVLTYASTVGRGYRTTIRVEGGVAEMVNDERVRRKQR